MPMNRALYPPDWDNISRQVRDEAGNRCERCGVANGSVGARDRFGHWLTFDDIERVSDACIRDWFGCDYPKIIRIVLTVHHIDADKSNNDRSNLVALCQRCHLAADRPRHTASAAATRARKRAEAVAASGQGSLL